LDEKGRKMSKSLGNIVDPRIIIEGGKNQQTQPPYGADVLRLWVSSVDYSSDVCIGQNIIKQLGDVYRKIRNTARFLLGNLHDFNPETDAVAYADLPELDKYMLHRMTEVFTDVTEAFESFQFFRFFQTVQNFCVVDLSNFYLDIAKDRLYISHPNSFRRRSCQTVLAIALESLAKAIAPVLCHMAEDIWQFLPYPTPYKSVFESGWVEIKEEWKNPVRAVREQPLLWDTIRNLRDEVNKVMEEARKDKAIGSSLDAKVLLYLDNVDLRQKLAAYNSSNIVKDSNVDELRYFFLASQVELVDSIDAIDRAEYQGKSNSVSIGIVKADGEKCDRCWNYSTTVGTFKDDPTICDRCDAALKGEF
jgi:isoleucyl-tRNA synthetase